MKIFLLLLTVVGTHLIFAQSSTESLPAQPAEISEETSEDLLGITQFEEASEISEG